VPSVGRSHASSGRLQNVTHRVKIITLPRNQHRHYVTVPTGTSASLGTDFTDDPIESTTLHGARNAAPHAAPHHRSAILLLPSLLLLLLLQLRLLATGDC